MTEMRHTSRTRGACDRGVCDTLQMLAFTTWKNLAAAQNLGLSYNEETITENALLTIATKHSRDAIVFPFNKTTEEPLTGADWEWWIGTDVSGWLGLRVQAKRIAKGDHFSNILTKTSGKNGPLQIDTLIAAAKADTAARPQAPLHPIYCLYIREPLLGTDWWTGPKGQTGCVLAPAQAIKVRNSNKLADIVDITLPWHLLACWCESAKPSGVQLLQSALEKGGVEDAQPIELAAQLPDYIRLLQEVAAANEGTIEFANDQLRENIIRQSGGREREIGGIILLDISAKSHWRSS